MFLRRGVLPVVFMFAVSVCPAGEDLSAPFERAFKAAPLALAGKVTGLNESGNCSLQVEETLKGQGVEKGTAVSIDVSVAPMGAWPSLGTKLLVAVVKAEKGGYRLYSRFGSMLPAESAVVASVRRMIGTLGATVPDVPVAAPPPVPPPVPKGGDIGPEAPVKPAVVHVSDSIDSQVLAAELIVIGRVVEVGFSKEAGERAVLRFMIETRLLGGGVPDIVEVHVPAPDAAFAGELPFLRMGRYCLFLRSRRAGSGLDIVSPYYGVYYLDDATQEALLKEKIFNTPTMRERKSQAPILTTMQATLGVWQEAWNGKNLARLIACYARGSEFRRLYDAGGKYRLALDRKLREFPGTVTISILGVSNEGPEQALASVELMLEVEGARERRNAEMRFVREEGEWRILEEGF